VATDTKRKEFLVYLLDLTIYSKALALLKAVNKEVQDRLIELGSKQKTIKEWLNKYSSTSLQEKDLVEVPNSPAELVKRAAELSASLNNIKELNKRITQNNTYKQLIDNTVLEPVGERPEGSLLQLDKDLSTNEQIVSTAQGIVNKLSSMSSICYACKQPIDTSKNEELLKEQQAILETTREIITQLRVEKASLSTKLKEWETAKSIERQYEEYSGLYNPELPTTVVLSGDITNEIEEINKEVRRIGKQIEDAVLNNSIATQHNAKVSVLRQQIEEFTEQLKPLVSELTTLTDRSSTLQILIKAFSPSGIVAYKIECMIKDLEEVTNEYLAEISGGRFVLSFEVSLDKLNVVVMDNGTAIDISALSGGELTRVNVAALLGIRKLLQSLSGTQINLLFLDETIEKLDPEGKEKLVDILIKEEYLNTFIVSHGFTHPLLEKLVIIKEDNISRIE
jgi:hypothetical protein